MNPGARHAAARVAVEGLARSWPALALVALLATAPPALGDGLIYVHDPVQPPQVRPWPRPHFPLEVTRHRVTVDITENLARTRVEETFQNPNPAQLEGTYLFPLPAGAAVSGFSMKVNGKEVSGEVLEKGKARETYEEIVRRSRDPGLLEYVERDLYRARVFPIPPRGAVDISIEYSGTLPRSGGLTRYSYPLDTGKYSAGPYRNVTVDIRLQSSSPLRSISCPSHGGVSIVRKGEREARVSLEAKTLRADRDFLLDWNVGEDTLAPFLLTHRDRDGTATFFIGLRPRPDPTAKPVPKDIVFVIDTSGSMAGHKIDQVKEALRYCLQGLNPGDRFNVIDFSTEARRLRDTLIAADEAGRKAALARIDELVARGGTNIEEALRLAVSGLSDSERLQMVVFLTDGEPTIGPVQPEEILESLEKANTGHRRVFVFGVGSDLNAKLLDRVARETRAATQYIRGEENLEVPLSTFYDKIDSPVLTDLTLQIRADDVRDVFPRDLPDLFRGEQLEVLGQFATTGPKTVVLEGKLHGERRVFEYALDFQDGDNPHLATHWAQRKIGFLLEQMRLSGESGEIRDEVIRLSKRHGILTPYTSYLILEEDRLAGDRPGESRAPAGALRPSARVRRLADSARYGFDAEEGEAAVEASRDLSKLKGGSGQNLLDRFLEEEVNAGEARVRRVQGSAFYRAGNRWVDAALGPRDLEDSRRRRELRYLSSEYFELLHANPQLGKILAIGPEIAFLWKGEVVVVTAAGS